MREQQWLLGFFVGKESSTQNVGKNIADVKLSFKRKTAYSYDCNLKPTYNESLIWVVSCEIVWYVIVNGENTGFIIYRHSFQVSLSEKSLYFLISFAVNLKLL